MASRTFDEGKINGVKVFAATMAEDRARLGERVTEWLAGKRRVPGFALREVTVTQSSDSEFHCVAITAFYWESVARKR